MQHPGNFWVYTNCSNADNKVMSVFARHHALPRGWTQGRSLLLAGFLVAACAGLSAARAQAQLPDTRPSGYVSDFAGVMSAQGKQRLEALATEVDRKTGSQLAIVTINSLQGEPIEDFSVNLATKWGIGRKAQGDTGVMLLLAIQDRKSRMEVGYGIEPIIPDGRAGMILRDMRPRLREGDYDGALIQAAGEIASFIAQAKGVTLNVAVPQPGRPGGERRGSPLGSLIWLLFFIIFPLLMFPRRRRRGWYGGSTTGVIVGGILGSMLGGGGGRGGGGFSSGGFGGFGGGGFGGGGASSSW